MTRDPVPTDTTADTGGESTTTTPTRPRVLPTALLALAAALVVVGVVFLVRAHGLDDEPAARNAALVDRGTTSAVVAQVSTGLNEVLSYDYRRPQVAQAAAKRWLTGDAPAQYQQLFTALRKLAPGQQLTFVARVSTAGVTDLRDRTAQLLVFLDQRSTRASDQQSSVSAAQVRITAVRSHDRWQISELVPL
ncbi:Mce-associated membrane protein [Jatrophihabitans endophyticus]|uniref:Mce-associated membrane protein n=1 Tax=Jatrophihabitans endophyticus TaxID=1206085 RepID=A0A1M5ETT7_9ACTN|nr:hypothetical protein [Jatrophihabitans endophyticus]SHF82501.1 Mce-associated membrane protein [Jatrophihabitans endophyticus]